MGLKLFDQYTYLHFASGIIAYYLGLPMLWWFIAHTVFEITENMKIGIDGRISGQLPKLQIPAWAMPANKTDWTMYLLPDFSIAILYACDQVLPARFFRVKPKQMSET